MSSASSEKTCVSVYVPVMGRSPRLDVPEVCVRVHVSIIRQIIAHGYPYVNEVRRFPRLLLPLRQSLDDSLGRLGVEGERRVNDNVMLLAAFLTASKSSSPGKTIPLTPFFLSSSACSGLRTRAEMLRSLICGLDDASSVESTDPPLERC